MLPKKWPQWIIIPIGFLLVAAIVGLGLGLVKGVQASTPSVEAMFSPTSTYEASLQNPDLLAYAHYQEGLECLDCHKWETGQISAAAMAEGSAVQSLTKMDFCLDCHVDNEHTSYEQVAGRTTDYVLDGENINPHDPHPDDPQVEAIPCDTCHKMHSESLLSEGCYASWCHHDRIFESCSSGSGCHSAVEEGE
jgi:hypothetical protein